MPPKRKRAVTRKAGLCPRATEKSVAIDASTSVLEESHGHCHFENWSSNDADYAACVVSPSKQLQTELAATLLENTSAAAVSASPASQTQDAGFRGIFRLPHIPTGFESFVNNDAVRQRSRTFHSSFQTSWQRTSVITLCGLGLFLAVMVNMLYLNIGKDDQGYQNPVERIATWGSALTNITIYGCAASLQGIALAPATVIGKGRDRFLHLWPMSHEQPSLESIGESVNESIFSISEVLTAADEYALSMVNASKKDYWVFQRDSAEDTLTKSAYLNFLNVTKSTFSTLYRIEPRIQSFGKWCVHDIRYMETGVAEVTDEQVAQDPDSVQNRLYWRTRSFTKFTPGLLDKTANDVNSTLSNLVTAKDAAFEMFEAAETDLRQSFDDIKPKTRQNLDYLIALSSFGMKRPELAAGKLARLTKNVAVARSIAEWKKQVERDLRKINECMIDAQSKMAHLERLVRRWGSRERTTRIEGHEVRWFQAQLREAVLRFGHARD